MQQAELNHDATLLATVVLALLDYSSCVQDFTEFVAISLK